MLVSELTDNKICLRRCAPEEIKFLSDKLKKFPIKIALALQLPVWLLVIWSIVKYRSMSWIAIVPFVVLWNIIVLLCNRDSKVGRKACIDGDVYCTKFFVTNIRRYRVPRSHSNSWEDRIDVSAVWEGNRNLTLHFDKYDIKDFEREIDSVDMFYVVVLGGKRVRCFKNLGGE